MTSKLPPREIPATQWSLVARAHDARTSVRRPALEELVRRYAPALRAHLLFRMRLDEATAHDVIQGFLADKLLPGRLTAGADPTKGRFRSLLVRALENYAIDVLRRNRRDPARGPIAPELDDQGELAATPGSADIFNAAWAREILVRALREMRSECQAQLCEARWLLFERRLLRPLLEDEAPPAYETLVEEFHFASPQQAANALVSAKRHFERVLSGIVGEYADGDEEIEREMRDLRAIVSAAGPLGLRMGLLDEAPAAGSAPLADDSSRGGELLAELFIAGGQEETPWRTEDYPGLWLHQLAQPLVSVFAETESDVVPRSLAGNITVADLLRHPEPPLEQLRTLKEIARSYVRAGRTDIPGEIATALYFAAIAAAYARCRQRITKSDDAVLEHGLRLLLTRTWLDDETRFLLRSVWLEFSIEAPGR